MVESGLRGMIEFFTDIGMYDVILPFLLVFAIVFAILEKTKVFGVDTIEGKEYTKKNINAIIAFVMSFLVIASSQLVAIINEALANIVLLLILSVCFLMLIGSFYHHTEKVMLTKGWRKLFMVIMFVGIVLIFLNAIKVDGDVSVIMWVYTWLSSHWTTNFGASVIFLVIIIFFMLYATKEPKGPNEYGSDSDSDSE